MKRFVVAFFFIFLTGIIMAGFRGDAQLPDVHDPTIAYRTQITLDLIRSGQFAPSWHNTLNYGFGYPLNLYYSPLITAITSSLALLTGNVVLGVKVALFIITLVGIYGVFFNIKGYGYLAGITAATAYALLPYHASSLYVRGSYAEYLALNLLPWVIYFWTKPLSRSKNLAYAALLMALFLISHNTISFVALPIIILISLLSQKQNYKEIILATLLSFLVSAVFLIPIFFERSYIQVDAIAKKTVLSDHFVELSQLWYSPWGYGGSVSGNNDLMSFMLGKVQLVLGLFGLMVALAYKDSSILLKVIPLIATLFLVLPNSRHVWELIPALSILQFPWRLLGIATLSLAYASGYFFSKFKGIGRRIVFLVVIAFLIRTNLSYFKPWNLLTYNSDILNSSNNLYPLAFNKIPEYLPIWMSEFPLSPPNDGLKRTATLVTGDIVSDSLSPINIQTAYMPHWRLTLNGYPTDIIPTPEGTIRTHAPIPPGSYNIMLTWHRTPIEQFGLALSLMAILIMLGLLI